MDNTNQNADALILDKKLQNYGRNYDFVAPKELTITITLAEYRELVSNDSKQSFEREKLQDKYWKLEAENEKLKKTIEALRLYVPTSAPSEGTEVNDG